MPLSTGMALTLTLLGLREARPGARYVVWSRIDQKTCLKCIAAAGYIPVVVELLQRGDELTTDVQVGCVGVWEEVGYGEGKQGLKAGSGRAAASGGRADRWSVLAQGGGRAGRIKGRARTLILTTLCLHPRSRSSPHRLSQPTSRSSPLLNRIRVSTTSCFASLPHAASPHTHTRSCACSCLHTGHRSKGSRAGP